MRTLLLRLSAVLVLTTVLAQSVRADVLMPGIFSSGMVLQRDQPVPIWGWAGKDEEITISFREQQVTGKANQRGNWRVTLQPLEAGGPDTLTISGTTTVKIEDVLVGEVWVCSGQSNMEWSVTSALDSDLELAAANRPQIRLLQIPRGTDILRVVNVDAAWENCTPKTLGRFSAVGYCFGRQLHETLGVPVGIIHSSWGGTPAESWISQEALTDVKDFRPILEYWRQRKAKYDPVKVQEEHEKKLAVWEAKVKDVGEKAAGQAPREELYPNSDPHNISVLFNAMINPLIPYGIRGAIWYQGESNASRAYQYRKLMPTLIKCWREAWGQGDFPFLQVQLANYKEIKSEPGESDWAELREAQWLTTQTLPNVGAACITDIGATKDIHPKDKLNVGKRLARLALHDVYGMSNIVPRGPVYREMKVDGHKIVLKFDTFGSGLTRYYKEPLTGFAICGEDKKWVWGQAQIIDGETVEVSHPEIQNPVAVRYNWADNPQGNLFNEQYLPAYPFRTDDWEGITANKTSP